MSSSSLRMVEAKLPPGFRFHPRDEELVCDYLMRWLTRSHLQHPLLIEVDLNNSEPWEIPETACVGGKEWYFYSQRDKKYVTGLRTNRATISGYWKATGKDRPVLRKGTLVGMRKTLVFYQGRAPKGRKTDWVMHEFRLEGPLGPPKLSSSKEDWVLCRVFFKNRDQIVTKQDHDVGSGCGGGEFITSPSSSSLPQLVEPYITFDQTHHHHHHHHHHHQMANANHDDHHYEQVPCFSIYAKTPPANQTNYQTNNNFSSYITHMDTNIFSTKIDTPNSSAGPNFPDFGAYINNSSTSDKMVIKAVLNQLTQTESNPSIKFDSPSFGEAATSSDSFLSQVGLSNIDSFSF